MADAVVCVVVLETVPETVILVIATVVCKALFAIEFVGRVKVPETDKLFAEIFPNIVLFTVKFPVMTAFPLTFKLPVIALLFVDLLKFVKSVYACP